MDLIPISSFTTATLDGTGIFDVLMRANKAHLESEFDKGRIKGSEYSTVYLASLQTVMQVGLQFVLDQQKAALEGQLLTKQIALAQAQIDKTASEKSLVDQQITNAVTANTQEIAKTAQITQQTTNLANQDTSEGLKQTLLTKEALKVVADTAQVTQQTANLVSQKAELEAQTALINQQKANALSTNDNILKEGCKLAAEYDVLVGTVTKTTAETGLLNQKKVTEQAQVSSSGVDGDSVVGRQKALYLAQTNGFARTAEQAAAKLLTDSWSVRRTTDTGTVADGTNLLNDATVGRAITKMLNGIGA